jgi:uncharacterized protein YjbI with pentapeptide repeats
MKNHIFLQVSSFAIFLSLSLFTGSIAKDSENVRKLQQDKRCLGCNLKKISLRGTYLDGVNLQRANLEESDLRDTNLSNADLQNANLKNADLRNSDLRGAILRGAKLWGANLRNAQIDEATILDKKWLLVLNCVNEKCLSALNQVNKNIPSIQNEYDSNNLQKEKCSQQKQKLNLDLEGANFNQTNLSDANFANTNLKFVNFSSAILQKTIIVKTAKMIILMKLIYSTNQTDATGNYKL